MEENLKVGKFNAEIIALVLLNVKCRKTLTQETLNRRCTLYAVHMNNGIHVVRLLCLHMLFYDCAP